MKTTEVNTENTVNEDLSKEEEKDVKQENIDKSEKIQQEPDNRKVIPTNSMDPSVIDIKLTSEDYDEGQENELDSGSTEKGITINYSFTNDGSANRKIVVIYPEDYPGGGRPFGWGNYPQTIDGGVGNVVTDYKNRTLTYTVSNTFVGIGAFEIFPKFNSGNVMNLKDNSQLVHPDCTFKAELYTNDVNVKQDDFLIKFISKNTLSLETSITYKGNSSIYEHEYNISPYLTPWQLPSLDYKVNLHKWPTFNEDIEIVGIKVYALEGGWQFDESLSGVTYGVDDKGAYAIYPINQTVPKGKDVGKIIELTDLKLKHPELWPSDAKTVEQRPVEAPILIAKYGHEDEKEYSLSESRDIPIRIYTCSDIETLGVNSVKKIYNVSKGESGVPLINRKYFSNGESTEKLSQDKHENMNQYIYTRYDFSGDTIQPNYFDINKSVPDEVTIEYVIANRDGSEPQTVTKIDLAENLGERKGSIYRFQFPKIQEDKTILSVTIEHKPPVRYGDRIDYTESPRLAIRVRDTDSEGDPITARTVEVKGDIWTDSKPATSFIEEFNIENKCGFGVDDSNGYIYMTSIGTCEESLVGTLFWADWSGGKTSVVQNPVVGIRAGDNTQEHSAINLPEGGVMRYIVGMNFTQFTEEELDGWVVYYTTNLHSAPQNIKAKDYVGEKYYFSFPENEWLTGELIMKYEKNGGDFPYPDFSQRENNDFGKRTKIPFDIILRTVKGDNFEGELLKSAEDEGYCQMYLEAFSRHDGPCNESGHVTEKGKTKSVDVNIRTSDTGAFLATIARSDIYQGNKEMIDLDFRISTFEDPTTNNAIYNYEAAYIELLDNRFMIASNTTDYGEKNVELITIEGKKYVKITPSDGVPTAINFLGNIRNLALYASPTVPVGSYSDVFGKMYIQLAGDPRSTMDDLRLDVSKSGLYSDLTPVGTLYADTLGLAGDGDTTTERMFIVSTNTMFNIKLNATTGTRLQPAANGIFGEIDTGKIVFDTSDVNRLGSNIYKVSANNTAYNYDSVIRLPVKDESITAGSGSGEVTYTHKFGMYMTGPVEVVVNEGNEGLKLSYELRSQQGTFVEESEVSDWSQVTALKVHYDKISSTGSNIFYMPLKTVGKPATTGDKSYLVPVYQYSGTPDGDPIGTVAGTAVVFEYKETDADPKYDLIYDLNGGDVGTGPKTVTGLATGTKQILDTASVPTRTGYTFAGWSEEADGGIDDVVTEVTIETTDKIVYAVWDTIKPVNQYTLTYHDTGATSGSAPIDVNSPYTENSEVTVLGNTGNLIKTNHIFKGWSKTENATTADYTVETIAAVTAKFTITENTDLYPVWEETSITFTFEGTKKLTENGQAKTIRDGQFTFDIAADRSNDASGYTGFTPRSTDVTSAGKFTFDEMTFVKTGTYKFVMTERNGNIPGYTYDDKAVTATVSVGQNVNTQEMEIRASYEKDGKKVSGIIFENTYTAPNASTVTLGGQKTLTGSGKSTANILPGQFTFHIEAGTQNDASGYTGFTAKDTAVKAGGGFTFDTIQFVKAGIYTFVITENNLGAAGYRYDAKEVIATVTVTHNAVNNKLETAVQYTVNGKNVNAITFENTYQVNPVVMVDPPVEKVIRGTPQIKDTFTFKMQAVSSTAGIAPNQMPMPNGSMNGEKIVTIKGSGSVEFGFYTYTQSGTYVYHITEIAGDGDYTYDKTVYIITDVVTDENGQLKVKRTISDGTKEKEKAIFINVYKEKVEEIPTPGKPDIGYKPEMPDISQKPSIPYIPESPSTSDEKTSYTPQTDDLSNMTIYMIMLSGSVVLGLLLAACKRRKNINHQFK